MNCKKCGNKLRLIEIFSKSCKVCSDKEEKEMEKLKQNLEKSKQKNNEEKEKIRKAEDIIKENTVIYEFGDSDIKRKKYLFYKSDFGNGHADLLEFENSHIEIVNPFKNEGEYSWFTKEKIVEYIIANKFNLKKTIDSLWKEHIKEDEENDLKSEMNRIKQREERRAIKEKAEKALYGKVKTKREALSEELKEMIYSKFENKCAVCNKDEGLHIHHKDKNPSNNRLDNLIILCGVCHKKIHMNVR